jgi:hypothetical protein
MQKIIREIYERRTWRDVNNREGGKNYRRLRNESRRATEKAEKKYVERMLRESRILKNRML